MDRKPISLKVNGLERRLQVDVRTTLLDMVRDQLGLTAAKLGCDIQVCGACTLLVNGRPVSACSMLAADADGCEVLTLEGLSKGDALHPLQESFMEYGALQCGYCTPGFVMACKAFLDKNPNPSIEQVRKGLGGNLCRCGTYVGITQAVLQTGKKKGGRANA